MAGIKLLFPGQQYFVGLGALYVAILALLAVPFFQSHVVYLNAVRLPLFADFSTPEAYGLSPNKTANFKITTPDGESIGAWFVLSDRYYHSLPAIPSDPAHHIKPALERHPVVLFLHGNAATRAVSPRVRVYQAYTARFGANVMAIDYRGFGDSTGKPSEAGLTRDARAAFDWLVAQGKKPEDILIIGHSLGTGVSGQLGAELAAEGIKPRGIVLLSPFSSITDVLHHFNFMKVIPLIKPLASIPGALQLVARAVVHRFDTLKAVPEIDAPVLIAHAVDDWTIPDSHSDVLFEAFLEPFLPSVDLPEGPFSSITQETWVRIAKQREARQARYEELVHVSTIPKFGTVSSCSEGGRKVVLVKTLAGGHDYMAVQEGVQDLIAETFALGY